MAKRGSKSRRVKRTVASAEARGVGVKVTRAVASKVARIPRSATGPAWRLSDEEVAQLVLAAVCAIRTVQRWAAGFATLRTTALRLERAMLTLGIPKRPKERGSRRRVAVATAAAA